MPQFGVGKPYNDYGQGFYCTESPELAKEWACPVKNDGYCNCYELHLDDLQMMRLTHGEFNILSWLAILLTHRRFDISSPVAQGARDYILSHFLPDTSGVDVMIGYRADDSYFSFAEDFVSNTISLRDLNMSMQLGTLGEQIVLLSKRPLDTSSSPAMRSRTIGNTTTSALNGIRRPEPITPAGRKPYSSSQRIFLSSTSSGRAWTMTIRAYDSNYLSKASRALGAMLHDAVYQFGMDGGTFLDLFIQSGVAEAFESGSPKYIAGKSGLELYLEVMERTTGRGVQAQAEESYERSDAYWVGWMLAHYQWYSGHSFRSILDTVPYDELAGLYGTLHEADIQKAYEVMDTHFSQSMCALKAARKRAGLTQEELSERSGVSLSALRAYERRGKDLSRAQAETVLRLANALKCEIPDILD